MPSTKRGRGTVVLFGVTALGVAVACGTSGSSDGGGDTNVNPTPDGSATDDAFGGGFGDAAGLPDGSELVACATDTQKAAQLPLDLYVMMDTSASMWVPISSTLTQWSAVRSALIAFLQDPQSAGMGVGLQFFPLRQAGVPASCTAGAQCPGNTGKCTLNICAGVSPNSSRTVRGCDVKQDCGPGEQCVAAGECSLSPRLRCFNINGSCGTDPATGFNLGTCTTLTSGDCENGDSCTAADYTTPAVAIAPLPGANNAQVTALTNALNAKNPDGNTPTSAALQGAVTTAASFGSANPGHTVAVVLATDGVPSECATDDPTIRGIASTALAGNPSVRTFVIGVFPSSQTATVKPRLDGLAQSGGTGSAFLVTANGNTNQQFLQALNQIRGVALPCDYELPKPESGTPDYGKVNVKFTSGSGTTSVLLYSQNAAGCDPNTGGWYYDVDPSTGGTPTKIKLCPVSCTGVKADTTGKIDIVQGCKTLTVPPK